MDLNQAREKLNSFKLQDKNGYECYPSMSGAFKAMLTFVLIDVDVYGDDATKAKVARTISQMMENSSKLHKG